jgi:hypothetical protein
LEAAYGSRRDAVRGLFVAGGFLVLALAGMGVYSSVGGHGEELSQLALDLQPGWLLAGWGLMTSGMVALALRWRAFFPPDVKAPLFPLTAILLVGGLLNYALPGPAGEVVGAALAARRFGLSTERALAAGVAARFTGLGLAGLVAVLLVESGVLVLPPDLAPWLRATTLVIGGLAAALLVLAAFPEQWKRLARATTGRVRWLSRLHAAVERMADALSSLTRIGWLPWLRGAGWALVGHGLVILGVALAARSIGAFPSAAGLVFTYAASTAGAIVLFAFPGGQLGWDGLFASLLVTAAGLEVSPALALTLLVRLQQLLLVTVGAIVLIRALRDGTRALIG